MAYYIGVDVGTSSVRAAVVKQEGLSLNVVHSCVEPIEIWNNVPNHFEQSSQNIWEAVASTVKNVLLSARISPGDIKGVGFDATCSLVVLDQAFHPVCISSDLSESRLNTRNVMMWMDHRASDEAAYINSTNHPILKFVGGIISVEMEMPKVLWIKKHLPQTWGNIGALIELPDFLTYKATGCMSRSLCSLVCKWAYDASKGSVTNHHWNDDFLTQIGLADLIDNEYSKLGNDVRAPGQPVGNGLSETAAKELGLVAGTPVGTSLIDAHAGGIGMLICKPLELSAADVRVENKLGLICGTSTCHMIVSERPAYVPGVWGPYYSAMVPDMWLNEGGQSATGKLIDHIMESHPAYASLKQDGDCFSTLSSIITQLSATRGIPEYQLTQDLHVYPDFHGNRSPLANPDMKGMICGLTLGTSREDLAVLYLATLQSLVYGTRHIVEEMEANGHCITTAYMCGGLTKNQLFVQMTANILNIPVVISAEPESVLVGSALLGLCASQSKPLTEILSSVQCDGAVYKPNQSAQGYHSLKYKVFKKMCADQLSYNVLMKGVDA